MSHLKYRVVSVCLQDGPSDSDIEPKKKKKQGSVKLEDCSSPEKDSCAFPCLPQN